MRSVAIKLNKEIMVENHVVAESIAPMEFTGERFVPEALGNIELEHWHRYVLARELAVGKDVLDIASGEGYGSAFVAEVANQVTGVDIAIDAVKHANGRYQRENLQYLEGSCAAIPLPDHAVDLIVSFETIEHHDEHDAMMREFKRVLRPDGCLLISSPDKHFYSEVPNYQNPYHVKELYEVEFKDLLSSWYKNARYFNQRLVYGSAVLPESGQSEIVHNEMIAQKVCSNAGLPRPDYWIALASDADLPVLSTGLFEQNVLESEVLGSWKRTVDAKQKALQESDEQLKSRAQELQALREELDGVTQQLAAIKLKSLHNWTFRPVDQARIIAKFGFRAARYVYRKVPFSAEARVSHRRYLQKNWPTLWNALVRVRHGQLVKKRYVAMGTPYTEFPWRTTPIALPSYKHPLISIIVPIYGKYNYTLRCLASIQRHLPGLPFEVIVIDDCSPDESRDILANVEGIRLLLNEENQGFLRSCNIAAKAALGEYLYFLNNDTEVTQGWLESLVSTFDKFPGAGLVGSKLVYPDGVLQEAGGIIWRDGSAWNFGRYQDPSDPVYCYARETDYCSGASIMVPTSLFHELGGFDELYLPAYCEDSDLALRIRSRGYRVIYQPQSVVVHYEGVSNGTDLGSGIKSYQVENMRKQYERWRDLLDNYQDNAIDVDQAKDRGASRRVLVLDHRTPTPDRDAGSMVVFNLMLLLREMGFQVTFIPEDNYCHIPGVTDELQAVGVEVLYAPYCTSVIEHLKTCGHRYDLAILVRPGVMERHLESVRCYCPNAKVLYHTIDLHHLRMEREAAITGDKRSRAAQEMKLVEFRAIRHADAAIVVSTAEKQLLDAELPGQAVFVLPLIMNVLGTKIPFAERSGIMFVGGYEHAPNVDAVEYFVAEVLPLVHRKLPEIQFYVVGSNLPERLKALSSEHVVMTGFVDDLQAMQDHVRINVAPLRYGAGIKGKVGGAMAAGLPSVVTNIAAEGMGLEPGENVLVANSTEEMARLICDLYSDEMLWSRLSAKGIDFAEQAWGAQAAWSALENILGTLGMKVQHSDRPLSLWNPGLGIAATHKMENKQ